MYNNEDKPHHGNQQQQKQPTQQTPTISKEMQQAKDKIAQMSDDINNKFTKTDDLKRQFEDEKNRLQHIRAFLKTYKNGLTKQVTYHSMRHDTKKNKILQSEIYNRLNDIEKKLIENESQIYAIQ